MAIPKYKKQYQDMIDANRALFDSVKKVKKGTEEFKELQMKILRIVRRNEDALCNKTENTRFTNFSTTLADKFLEEIRAEYPEIDFV